MKRDSFDLDRALRMALETKAVELIAGLRDRTSLTVETSAEDTEHASAANLRELESLAIERRSQLLYEITEALSRQDAGTYGVCEQCGERISRRRLEALPWARHCLRCQEQEDSFSQPSSFTHYGIAA